MRDLEDEKRIKEYMAAKDEHEPAQNMKTYKIVCPHCDKPHDWTYLKGEWVGLTDEEIKSICNEWKIMYGGYVDNFAKFIEAKLKEKNGG